MTDIASIYNHLPSIVEADKNFVNRQTIFDKLAPLFEKYENNYGYASFMLTPNLSLAR